MSLKFQKFLGDRNYAISKTLFVGVITLLLASLFLLSKTVTEVVSWSHIGEGDYIENTINVTGEGEAIAVPDVATFTFSVNVTADDVEAAQTESATKMNESLEYLKSNGVEEKDVKTTSYNAYPRYEYTPCRDLNCTSSQRLVGYEVSQSVKVTVRKTEEAGKLLSGIGSRGATNVSGLSFEIDDPSKLEEDARSIAIKDAKEKAERLAKDLGVKLKGIISFGEDQGYYPEPYMTRNAFGGEFSEDAAVSPQLPTGENTVKRTVYITYEIK
ncbi:SIMPL domain-containing protein [Candidatus Pacebacteria bacterium]|nr:SIMPL domain-containing protein [Candidatus Paceibacterota bacterium]